MPRIYVGTYGKYAAGSIKGEWLDLEDYTCKEEFITACLELHADEDDPELMFQDHEGVPSCFITECSIDENFWDYMECNADDGAKEAYCEVFGEWNGEESFRDKYIGEFDSREELAADYIDGTGMLSDMPEQLQYYFDYDAYGRDMILGGDVKEENGHYFNNY